MSDPIFADGFILKAPHEKAPEWVKGSLSINVAEAIAFLEKNKDTKGWVNLDLKVGKSNKWYVQKNDWKPATTSEATPELTDDEKTPF